MRPRSMLGNNRPRKNCPSCLGGPARWTTRREQRSRTACTNRLAGCKWRWTGCEVTKYSVRHSKEVLGVTPEVMEALRVYDWPGNIRELENIIERGVILAHHHGKIELAELFPSITIAPVAEPAVPFPTTPPGTLEETVDLLLDRNTSLQELENRLLDAAVTRSQGNLSSAARLLGMTRPQLAYRLKKRDLYL